MTQRGALVLRALTDRERAILILVAAGMPNKTIGQRIGTSEQVVKNHMREILQKSGRRNRTELVVFCFRHGVVTCPCSHSGAI